MVEVELRIAFIATLFKITVYPGKGQVQPRVYFGSGPTKKDAKFACGSVAWSNLEGGLEPSADAQVKRSKWDIFYFKN